MKKFVNFHSFCLFYHQIIKLPNIIIYIYTYIKYTYIKYMYSICIVVSTKLLN